MTNKTYIVSTDCKKMSDGETTLTISPDLKVKPGQELKEGVDFYIAGTGNLLDQQLYAWPLPAQQVQGEGKQKSSVVIIHKGERWYWCKCESCGWENSSEYAEGGHPIGDTGDYSDPMCPVCGSLKLEAESKYVQEESYEKQIVEIPFDDFIRPYQKQIEKLQRLESEMYWSQVEEKGGLDEDAAPVPHTSKAGEDGKALAKEYVKSLGWELDGTAEPNDMIKCYLAGYAAKQGQEIEFAEWLNGNYRIIDNVSSKESIYYEIRDERMNKIPTAEWTISELFSIFQSLNNKR